jgi:hypothetical protein
MKRSILIVVSVVLLFTGATAALGDDAPPQSPTPVPPSTAKPSPSTPAAAPSEKPAGGGSDAAAVGKALSNPVSDVWALFTEFDFSFNEGDIPGGDGRWTYNTIFQPVMPIKLTENWKLITRPTIPIIWSTPLPKLDLAPVPNIDWGRKTGLGDTELPLIPAPNDGLKWGPGELVGGVGPTFTIPTSTDDALGSQKWEVGVGAVAVYKTDKITLGAFPQYWWSVGNRKHGKERPKTSHGDFLYFFYYELGNAWQIGFNPTIAYNHEAPKKNRWNVPVGVTIAKTWKFGRLPVKFQLAGEYSVVNEDLYGKRWLIKLNVIPVIPDLIKKPLFGSS